MAKTFTFNKKEKLKSRKLMEELFQKGRSFTVFPLKVFYLEPSAEQDFPLKAAVGVSNKNFKMAVERNRIKRLLRETYRLEKPGLLKHMETHHKQLVLFLLYIDKVLPDYKEIKTKMNMIVARLIKQSDEVAEENI